MEGFLAGLIIGGLATFAGCFIWAMRAMNPHGPFDRGPRP